MSDICTEIFEILSKMLEILAKFEILTKTFTSVKISIILANLDHFGQYFENFG